MLSERKESERISFVISSLTAGGAERIISQLANYAIALGIEVYVIILSCKPQFYTLHSSISVHEPSFTMDQMSRLQFQWKNFWWLRTKLKQSPATATLSFGGKYNAFVLLAAMGLGKRVYISDRSRPAISYGVFLDKLNPIVYRGAAGIIAQTHQAKDFHQQKVGHSNIKVIPNPFPIPAYITPATQRKQQVLNVGRFIASKHQDSLLQYFEELEVDGWQLTFLGEGPRFDKMLHLAIQSPKQEQIELPGVVRDVEVYFQQASIFAFTSTSEGFPNALGEAMAHGCACIAFDCVAGPSDLIDDGVNGFLIPVGDHAQYKEKLQRLISEPDLRERFGKAAHEKMKQFSIDKIAKQYLDFMMGKKG